MKRLLILTQFGSCEIRGFPSIAQPEIKHKLLTQLRRSIKRRKMSRRIRSQSAGRSEVLSEFSHGKRHFSSFHCVRWDILLFAPRSVVFVARSTPDRGLFSKEKLFVFRLDRGLRRSSDIFRRKRKFWVESDSQMILSRGAGRDRDASL